MPVFDVEFAVKYRRFVRVEAADSDMAAEIAGEQVDKEKPELAQRWSVDWYGETVVKNEED